ncbi:hypothetical protein NLJ89_g68 [Agrocybe chaxingu]|uniref:Pheromone receptor n=1 Tax=Agrocybe chaxingu TaxID=84603 RepID=A0A9W8N2J1_9AGAR|nr:hypothetical protein NLJ89_g68 [Agrocybe chaxingu]
MAWTGLTALVLFINSVIWNDNAINWAPVWCDITSKLIVGVSVAIPAASLCINRRLYCIAAKRRAIIIDLAIGLGIPIIVMILHYIVQGHRFNIFEEIGCYPFTYNTPPAYVLVHLPPLLLGLTSGAYSIMSIIAFRKRHAEFKEILSSNSNLNANRYFRLMALAGIEVISSVPLSTTAIILNATKGQVQPWISWEDTHWGFSRVDQIPAMMWKADVTTKVSLEMTRWLVVVCGLVFFLFFGFADEAQKHYKLAFSSVAKRVGISTTGGASTKVGSGVTSSTGFGKTKGSANFASSQGAGIPIYVSQETVEKRDSLDSLSDMTSIRDASDFASEAGSNPSSPFSTLRKNSAEKGLKPPVVSSSASTHSSMTAVDPKPQTSDPSSRASLAPPGSFLDLTDTEAPKRGNDNKV